MTIRDCLRRRDTRNWAKSRREGISLTALGKINEKGRKSRR